MLIVQFDRSLVSSAKSNVFVKNLGPNATNKSLYQICEPYGEVFSIKLAQDYSGKSKGYGYVQYKNIADAEKAKAELNGKEKDGKILVVDFYKPSERKDRPQGFTNIYVRSLPPDVTTKEALDKLFEPFGPRTSVGIFFKVFDNKPAYYGFVNFEKPEDAAKAVAALNDKEVSGVKLFVTKALTKDQFQREKMRRKIETRNQSRKQTLYVKSKGEPLTKIVVEEELKQFGEIKGVTIQTTKGQEGQDINTVIGYVEFVKAEDAEKVPNFIKLLGC